MRRLITSRFVRLALAVTTAGAVIGAAVWAWRSLPRRGGPPSPQNPVRDPALVLDGEGQPGAEPERAEPVLGRPSAADLKRYDRPEGGAAVARLLNGESIRWRPVGRLGYLAAALCGVVIAGQFFEQAVFGPSDQASAGDDFWSCGVICSLWTEGRTTGFDRRYADMAGEDPSQGSVLLEPPDPACTPATQAVVPRPVDPRVAKAVDHQWRRIEKWLRARAPVTYGELRPPASAGAIALAESRMGVRLPASLRASLLRHNGSRATGFGFPGAGTTGVRALGVREMIRDTWRAPCAGGGAGAVNGRGILFAGFEGGPGLEADPERGVEVLSGDGLMSGVEIGWSSYYALLRDTARSLKSGRPLRGLRPEVSAGRLLWTPAR
ncbi:hypothetical protein ACOZ38_31795 [Sphaerisporangium viridialbum]|uniref:hypothetical protein n=1 Tax=Sphaerisporangium viridialbum TaxID=46189 RepID=UPI003C724476